MKNLLSILIFLSLAVAIGIIGRHLPEIKVYFQKKKKSSWRNFWLIEQVIKLKAIIGRLFLFLAEVTVKRIKNLLHLAHFWLIKLRKKKQEENESLREIEAKMELLEEEEKTLEKVISEDLGQEEEEILLNKFKKKSLLENGMGAVPEFRTEKKVSVFQMETKNRNDKNEADEEVEAFRQEKFFIKEEDNNNKTELEAEVEEQAVLDGRNNNIFSKQTERNDKENEQDKKIHRFFGTKDQLQHQDWEQQEKSENSFKRVRQQDNFTDETEFSDKINWEKEKIESEGKVIEDTESLEMEIKREIKPVKGIFSRLTDKFRVGFFKRNSDWENDFLMTEKVNENLMKAGEDFSDGIIKVGEMSNQLATDDYYQQENNLIKEVVKVTKKREEYSDDDLGVDREILERKIINKISLNPRDQENYRQLGDLYLKMENFHDAEECYKQVLKLKPRDLPAKRKLEKVQLLRRLRQK